MPPKSIQTDDRPAPALPPQKTVAEWGRGKGVEAHRIAAVRAYLAADELLMVTEAEFNAALAAFAGASLSQPPAR